MQSSGPQVQRRSGDSLVPTEIRRSARPIPKPRQPLTPLRTQPPRHRCAPEPEPGAKPRNPSGYAGGQEWWGMALTAARRHWRLRPAADGPTRAGSASEKSPEEIPLRYSQGISSSMALVFRRYGGKICDEKRTRPAGSGDLSRTRGCRNSSGPTPVKSSRGGR
jgi:hypothetical protein